MNPKTTMIAAAVAGLLAGVSGCRKDTTASGSPSGAPTTGGVAPAGSGAKHACRGKNDCKGQGGCATDKHGCKGQNACKGQGGCNMS